MSSFFLIRHGFTGISATEQEPGDALNDIGRQQAQLLASRIKNYDIHQIVSSPFTRAQDTAEIITNTIHASDFRIDKRLEEIVMWSDPFEMLHKNHDSYDQTVKELSDFKATLDGFLQDYTTDERQNTCIVAHGNVIRAFVMSTLELPDYAITRMRVSHASVTIVTKVEDEDGDYYVLDRFNDTAHLEQMK